MAKFDKGAYHAPAVQDEPHCVLPESFTLAKSMGVLDGKTHRLYKKGTKLVIGVDDAAISLLHRMGAVFA